MNSNFRTLVVIANYFHKKPDKYYNYEPVSLYLFYLQPGDSFRNHAISILVEKATTHSTIVFYLNDFRKNIRIRCPVNEIEWEPNGELKIFILRQELIKEKAKGFFTFARLIYKNFNVNQSHEAWALAFMKTIKKQN
ncbi:hypothetical protein BpHYR1_025464 [Brachionus plicatilis]|uniref:Uncharacterized protein n=1 Tax=Brachionus plicatilis TaxID=10195 RepID=A0A3M7RT99_BRAPC|nr:hypothetical protein BpHYR1_025464 [Brachionus plicatilis]